MGLYSSCCDDEGKLRCDPFGWDGLPAERPVVQADILDARRAVQAEESQIGWHVHLDPIHLSPDGALLYPTERTRSTGAWLAEWVRDCDRREHPQKGGGGPERMWTVVREGVRVALQTHGLASQRVWVYWDARVGVVGVDWEGRVCHSKVVTVAKRKRPAAPG